VVVEHHGLERAARAPVVHCRVSNDLERSRRSRRIREAIDDVGVGGAIGLDDAGQVRFRTGLSLVLRL